MIYKIFLDSINVPYSYTNIYEFFAGLFLSAMIVGCVDKALGKIAYTLTGEIVGASGVGKIIKSTIHWTLRFILLLLCAFIITKFVDITPPTQSLAAIIQTHYEGYWNGVANQLVEALTKIP